MGISLPVEAKLDARSFDAAATKAEQKFKQAGQDAGKSFTDSLASGLKSSDEAVQRSAQAAAKAYDRTRDSLGRVRVEQEKLNDLQERGGGRLALIAQSEKLERAQRSYASAVRDTTTALSKMDEAGQRAGSSLVDGLRMGLRGVSTTGRDAAEEFSSGFAGSSTLLRLGASAGPIGLALAGVAALGTVAGKQLADGIAQGMESVSLRDQFQARMGLDETSIRSYAAAAGQAYANNFGASLADNLDAAKSALQAGLIDKSATDAQVKSMVERLQGVSSITDASPAELSRSVSTLMRTGLADNAASATDTIVAGFQNGLDVSHDWLDTINEYSTQFRKFGLTADQVLTLLKQGLEGGARDTDKVADSLKEFSIRAVDGSKSTKEGFEALGFSADDMSRRFAAGGKSAEGALAATFDALKRVDDPMQQSLIWTRLFGTQFEDMGDAVNRFDLSKVRAEFTNLQGTSDQAMKTATDNFTAKWDTAIRTVETRFDELKTSLAEWATSLPVIRDLPDWITDLFSSPLAATGRSSSYTGQQSMRVTGPVAGGGLPSLQGGMVAAGPGTNLLGNLLGGGAGTPAPAGLVPGVGVTPTGPVAGPPVPIPATPEDAAKTVSDADRRQQIRDELLAGNPNFGAGAPPSPAAAMSAGGAPPTLAYGTGGELGTYTVDQRKVLQAQHALLSDQRDLQEAQIQLEVLKRDSLATQKEIQDAEWRVVEQGWRLDDAQADLAEAQQGTFKKLTSQASAVTSGMDQIGAALDNDLGLSKGWAGLAENLVKFLGNLALAPTLAKLSLTSALNPNQGSGLIGSLATQGAFGSRFMPQAQTGGGFAPVAGQTGVYPQPVAAPGGQSYGLATGTNTGGYGSSGPAFPPWVHALENAFGIKASTYAGHQESDRNEAGYAPNPQHLNRGIDWTGTTDAMQRFVDYLKTIPGQLEQVIFQNPATGQATEIAGGRSQPGYFAGDLGGHRDHVHTRQSAAIAAPAGTSPGADWLAMAQKEASGNWQANTGNGYYGGLQFLPSSWAQAGGLQYAPRADLATPQQQIAAGESLLAQQGPGAWPNTFTPYGGGIGTGAVGPGLAGPPQARVGGLAPAAGPPGGGNLGFGGGLIDLASAAGGIGLDAMAPGAGAAAQIGTQLAKRAIAFGGQVAGIGVGGLLETFLPHGSPLADPNRSWFGKFAAGIAGARPALPTTAGQMSPPAPNGQPGAPQDSAAAPGGGTTVNYTAYNQTEDRNGADLTRHLTAINSGPGR